MSHAVPSNATASTSHVAGRILTGRDWSLRRTMRTVRWTYLWAPGAGLVSLLDKALARDDAVESLDGDHRTLTGPTAGTRCARHMGDTDRKPRRDQQRPIEDRRREHRQDLLPDSRMDAHTRCHPDPRADHRPRRHLLLSRSGRDRRCRWPQRCREDNDVPHPGRAHDADRRAGVDHGLRRHKAVAFRAQPCRLDAGRRPQPADAAHLRGEPAFPRAPPRYAAKGHRAAGQEHARARGSWPRRQEVDLRSVGRDAGPHPAGQGASARAPGIDPRRTNRCRRPGRRTPTAQPHHRHRRGPQHRCPPVVTPARRDRSAPLAE